MPILRALLISVLSLVFLFSVHLIIPLSRASLDASALLTPGGDSAPSLAQKPFSPTASPTPSPLRALPTPEPTPAAIVDLTPDSIPSETPTPEMSFEEWFNSALGSDDADCDGIKNIADNCPLTFNPAQADKNKNGTGDICDPELGKGANVDERCDSDQDGILGKNDNCPLVCNPDQRDKNRNGIGDVCDPDLLREWVRIKPCPKPLKKRSRSTARTKRGGC